MKNLKAKFIGFIILLLITNTFVVTESKAQGNPDWITADSITYQQYLNKSWDSLLISANNYMANGIDFYYLQIRTGIAYYEKQNYTKAIKHFTKALVFNPSDPVATEYLYFANLYKGNDFEAKIWSNRLLPLRKDELGIVPHFIEGYSSDITINSTSEKEIPVIPGTTIAGTQQVPKYFVNANITLKHLPAQRFKIVHGYTFLYKNSLYYSKTLTTETSYTDKILQNQYFLSGTYYPAKGLQVTASWHQLWISVPKTSSGTGQGRNSSSFFTISNNSYSASIQQSLGYIDVGYTYTGSKLNNQKQQQHSIHLGVYPLGNLNLYLLNRIILFNENSVPANNSVIVGETFGIKLARHFWAEANVLAGNIKNMSDYGSYIIYNDINTLKLKSGLSFLFPLNSGKIISIRANYYNSESNFSNTELINNTIKYSSFSITGGISWNF